MAEVQIEMLQKAEKGIFLIGGLDVTLGHTQLMYFHCTTGSFECNWNCCGEEGVVECFLLGILKYISINKLRCKNQILIFNPYFTYSFLYSCQQHYLVFDAKNINSVI
jgi:hypothetical protein